MRLRPHAPCGDHMHLRTAQLVLLICIAIKAALHLSVTQLLVSGHSNDLQSPITIPRAQQGKITTTAINIPSGRRMMIRKLSNSTSTYRCAILPVVVLVLLAATDSVLCFDASNPCGSSASQTQLSDITVLITSNSTADEKRAATAHSVLLWPGGMVPYTISNQYTDREKRVILQCMSHWENKTCIRFKERTNEFTYLNLFPGVQGCCSYIGRLNSGEQGVSVGRTCFAFRTCVHEIGHALGFWHEQNRPDRDDYVTIDFDNIIPGLERNFEKLPTSEVDSLGVAYDYDSIMHYDSSAFAISAGQETIIPRDPNVPVGLATELSELDILQTNLLYQDECDASNPPPPSVVVPPPVPPTLPFPNCGQVFVDELSGSFESRNHPSNYPNNLDCGWVIEVPSGYVLTMSISLFGVSSSNSNCDQDYVAFYNGLDSSATYIGRICGDNRAYTLTFGANQGYVHFHSDSSVTNTGFSISFQAVDIDECSGTGIGTYCERTPGRCENTPGSFSCNCDNGYYLSSNKVTCHDIDECAVDNGGCDHECINSKGSFKCQCNEGYELQPNGKACSQTAEIPLETCSNAGCAQRCTDTVDGPVCSCNSGYVLDSFGKSCSDINECAVENGGCQHICTNTPGGHTCSCNAGYTSSEKNCLDIDECAVDNGGCDHECVNSKGSFKCQCNEGYELQPNGKACSQTDPCSNAGCTQSCTNTEDEPVCSCNSGYVLDSNGKSCSDINECAVENGGCQHICANTPGSHTCSCNAGYTSSGKNCVDVNECLTNNGGCSHTCTNTPGSHHCSCDSGYELGSDQKTCVIPSSTSACGGIFTADTGGFTSLNYPNKYLPNMDCYWTINLNDPTKTIEFTFASNFFLQASSNGNCKDYVEIYDGGRTTNALLRGKLCGRTAPVALTTSSNVAIIHFYSNNKRERAGFSLTYRGV